MIKEFLLDLNLIFVTVVLTSTAIAGSTSSTITIANCNENRDFKEVLELGKLRAQEKYLIEEPETFNELKRLANNTIAELDKVYEKDCKPEGYEKES